MPFNATVAQSLNATIDKHMQAGWRWNENATRLYGWKVSKGILHDRLQDEAPLGSFHLKITRVRNLISETIDSLGIRIKNQLNRKRIGLKKNP